MPVFDVAAGSTRLDLTLRRGDTLDQDVALVDDVGDPLDVSGWTWDADVREGPESSSVTASITVTVNDAANGDLTLELAAATSAALNAGRYVWDLEGTDSGTVRTVAAGYFDVPGDVSRA